MVRSHAWLYRLDDIIVFLPVLNDLQSNQQKIVMHRLIDVHTAHLGRVLFRWCKRKTQIFCKSFVWGTKCSQKINHIIQIDCKSRDESNEPN
jgi:hypothetical protein